MENLVRELPRRHAGAPFHSCGMGHSLMLPIRINRRPSDHTPMNEEDRIQKEWIILS
ncbi:MAG: hypothetical protein ACLQBQ_01980 [Smithella sp.]